MKRYLCNENAAANDREMTNQTSTKNETFLSYNILITPEAQVSPMVRAGGTFFTGVCGPDGHSQAPREGFMASREKGSFSHEQRTEDEG
jgi:hypothetical protein